MYLFVSVFIIIYLNFEQFINWLIDYVHAIIIVFLIGWGKRPPPSLSLSVPRSCCPEVGILWKSHDLVLLASYTRSVLSSVIVQRL